MIQQYDPLAIIQQPENKGGVCIIRDATTQSNVVAGTNTVIPASTGQKARIVSMSYSAVGATPGLMAITSNAVTKYADNQPPNTVQPVTLPFNPAGYCDSETGQSMVLVTTVTGNFSARYYYYTP